MQALEKSSSESVSVIENGFNFENQIKLQSIALEAAANGVMITDRHGQILWVNSALTAMTGYTKEELIGKNPNILKSNLQDSSIYERLWSKIIAGEIWQGEITNRRKDGSYYIEEQTIAPVLDPSGVTTNFIAIKSDISKRRELELIQNDMRETLVHDLRNPLNTILVSLELAEAYQLDNELAEVLKISLVGARRMLGMVNSLLDISKIESGAMPVNPNAFAIEDEISRTIQFQTPLAIPKKLILKFTPSPNLPLVLADKELVQRIMQNLLDNAIKFSFHGGDITITTNYLENQKAVVVGIQDHGIGIPPEIQPRLFQKFASSSQTLRSSGLGLAFCKMAVEAMAGRIWVESSSASTRFLFSLPSAPE